ncbi:cytochrome c551 [Virgibacillus sp. YIM 98842]|jgi:mono/diheme cytochrome c family protein|uniref:cytochrome c551 n=1 Tax=Virgibacillus sp. YIM 98842 TaxID=2663533 RepID=UPI0013DCD01F|nr:cytochrome c [Virgibacillus sp. YIM 98842]
MKKWLLTIVFGSALVLGACGGGDDGGTEEPADDGGDTDTEESAGDNGDGGGAVDTAAAEEAYEQSCASCHGADLSGGAGPDLQNVGSNYSAEEIADIIENGKGSMPAGLATGEDKDNIAAWLAEMQ